MGLTGIQIYKLLPGKNCKECGEPTCLAFAMKLAAGKAELDKCPYVSEEAKAKLAEASAPPIRGVVIGSGDEQVKVGEELVLYRHDKTFVNPTAVGVLISDKESDEEIEGKVKRLNETTFERVGLTLKANLVYVRNESGDPARFEAVVKKVLDLTQKGVILESSNKDALQKATELAKDRKPVIGAATPDTVDSYIDVAKATGASIIVRSSNFDEIIEMTKKITGAGIKDIIIDTQPKDAKELLFHNTWIRRAALKKKMRELGFPIINMVCDMTDDEFKQVVYATTSIGKYGSIVILSDIQKHTLFPLLVWRLNIYTDPQRPMVMEQGIYPINNPDENSPVCITTNFALTYFIVAAEIESSRVPTWLLVMDTEGLSVLTAWSAGKFVADAIAPFIQKSGITEKVKHRKVIIPGYVAAISGELQEELGDEWEVLVGPREATDLPAYLKNYVGQ